MDGGGAAGIFNNEQAILQWALSGPSVGQLLEEELNKKYEDLSRFKQMFWKDIADLFETFVMVIRLKRKQDWCILHQKY